MKDTSTKHKKTRRFDSDKLFKLGATVAGVYVLVIIVLIVFQLSFESYPIWAEEGLGFVTGTDWNPVEGRESFGVLPYIVGTLVTSAFAMAIGVPLSIGIAMFDLGFVVELLAAAASYNCGACTYSGFIFENILKNLCLEIASVEWMLQSVQFLRMETLQAGTSPI